jgi:bifunctional non-homologous end joining protein LigD
MKRCVWVKPSMVCEVKFTEWTRDDRLRQPVFLGDQEDKIANEVVREKPDFHNQLGQTSSFLSPSNTSIS